jgi:hypothetical protein
MASFDHVVEQIRQERERQFQKWGDQNHTDSMWYMIFMEEVGEIAKAFVEMKGGDAYPMKMELIHAVAVGFQWLEKL